MMQDSRGPHIYEQSLWTLDVLFSTSPLFATWLTNLWKYFCDVKKHAATEITELITKVKKYTKNHEIRREWTI